MDLAQGEATNPGLSLFCMRLMTGELTKPDIYSMGKYNNNVLYGKCEDGEM